jgi:hypothetical protein
MATKPSLDQLRKEPAFISLPAKFQSLVMEYLKAAAAGEPNPKAQAIQQVYAVKSKASARVMGCQYFAKPEIAEVLALAAGLTPREAFLAELRRLSLRRKSTPTQLAALRLFGQTMGFIDPAKKSEKKPADKSAPAHRFKVGDICLYRDKPHRVTAVDENGQPTAGDPL